MPNRTNRLLQLISYGRTWLGMIPNLFSQSVQEAFEQAKVEARELGQVHCAPVHMLLAMSRGETGAGARLLRHLKCSYTDLRADLVQSFGHQQRIHTQAEISFDNEFKIMLAMAALRAKAQHDWFIGTHHMFGALFERDGMARDLLRRRGIDYEEVNNAIRHLSSEGLLQD